MAAALFTLNANASSKLSRQDSLTIAKAEEAILKAAANYTPDKDSWNQSVPPHDDFEELIKNNPHTLDYPFKALQDNEYVRICTSEDGQLRYYSWDTGLGGSMILFSRIEQYRTPDGKVHVNTFTDGEFYSMALKIRTMKNAGSPIYLVEYFFREATCYHSLSENAVSIDDNGLHRPKIFEDADTLSNSLGVYCNSCYNHYQAEGYGDDFDYFYFNNGCREMFVAETENIGEEYNMLTDHYRRYAYDGIVFRYKKTVANPNLHASLNVFQTFQQAYLTKGYTIRIDKMKDGTYRYASWKRPKKMSENPDIIIYGGTHKKEQFIFNNEGYTYIVDDYLSPERDKYLIIKKGNKQVMRQKKIGL